MELTEKSRKILIDFYGENYKGDPGMVDYEMVVEDAEEQLASSGGRNYEMSMFETESGNPENLVFDFEDIE